ncbi:MAG: hypothetical protein HYW07_14895 [Candidatus Latescibacteria bacterium]|nr:hypothetical protein [Candidatus Latescibacterota bacterium]
MEPTDQELIAQVSQRQTPAFERLFNRHDRQTAYSFLERRPFFVEGNQLFSTPFQLFYSRRIGRQPDGGLRGGTARLCGAGGTGKEGRPWRTLDQAP